MSSVLPFNVQQCSGEDAEFPAAELNVSSAQSRGWRTAKFSSYPQTVVLALNGGGPCRLRQVQILSHEALVASRINLSVGSVPGSSTGTSASPSGVSYTSIGYLTMDDNARSDYRARELKKVSINATGAFLRIEVHAPHRNARNLFNQVGIIAVHLHGDTLGAAPPSAQMQQAAEFRAGFGSTACASTMPPPPLQLRTAPHALVHANRTPQGSRAGASSASDSWRQVPGSMWRGQAARAAMSVSPIDDLSHLASMDMATASIMRRVYTAKRHLVRCEAFDKAKWLKEVEGELMKLARPIAQLEQKKARAVAAEDYDTAQDAAMQLRGLRIAFNTHLAKIDFDGIAAMQTQHFSGRVGSAGSFDAPMAASTPGDTLMRTPTATASPSNDCGAGRVGGGAPLTTLQQGQADVQPRRMFQTPNPYVRSRSHGSAQRAGRTPLKENSPQLLRDNQINLEEMPIGGLSWGITGGH